MEDKLAFKIVCVGAGGTGGYFLKEFSRYLNGYMGNIKKLVLVDGDTVEEHNLTRQCFQKEDIGLSKAATLADALHEAFGTVWDCYPVYLERYTQLEDWLLLEENEIPIILGCVDNHGARMVMEEYFRMSENCIYFDSANEIQSGEVVLSYKIRGKQLSKLRSEIFPDVLKSDLRNVTEMSCEELNVVVPQHITVNMMAGLTLLTSVIGLIESNQVRPGMVCFNSFTMESEYIPLSMGDCL